MTTTIRHALRGLRAAPGLGLAAVLCMGLGTAATTSVATLVSAALLRPVPFPHGDRMVRIWFEEPAARRRIALSIPEIQAFAGMASFDAFLGTARERIAARLGSGAVRMRGEAVTFTLILYMLRCRLSSRFDHL